MFGKQHMQRNEPLNHIRITQSLVGLPVPIVGGTARVPGLLLWTGDFAATKHNQSGGGSGFGAKGATLYTYNASWISLLCQGPVQGIHSIWDQSGQYVAQNQTTNFTIPPATPATPSLSSVAGGPLAGATYYVKITYLNGSLESAPSLEASLAVGANNLLRVASPTAATSVTGWNVYVSTASGTETKQNSTPIAIGTPWTEPTSGLISGSALPAAAPHAPTASGGPPWGPVPAPRFGGDAGVSDATGDYSRVAWDSLGGAAVPTLNTGQYTSDGSGNYAFSSADSGKAITISNTYFYNNRMAQELHVVPAGSPYHFNGDHGGTISDYTGSHNIFVGDWGARYYPSGTALTKVGGSPAAGQYSVSISGGIGTYTFNSADASAEIVINYEFYDSTDDRYAPNVLAITFFPGILGQAAWSYLNSSHPDQSVSYSQSAYAAFQNAYLGMSASPPVHSFEVTGFDAVGGGVLDFAATEFFETLLTDANVGIGFPASAIDQNTWFLNADAADKWIKSQNLFFSEAILNQETLASIAGRWLEALQVAAFYSEGSLKLKPYGDQNVTGTLATYTANTTAVVSLTDDSFLSSGRQAKDPLKITEKPYPDRYNRVQVNYQNRINSYNADHVYEQDEASVARFGLRPESPVSFDFIPTSSTAAAVASMRLKRSVTIPHGYDFKLPSRYDYLEPMDLVQVTDTRLGLTALTVRLISVDNDPKSGLSGTCEDYPAAGYGMPVYNPKAAIPPLHPPHGTARAGQTQVVIVQATAHGPGPETTKLFLFCTGQEPEWGGCTVWASLDGSNYSAIAVVTQPARLGSLYAALASITPNPTGAFGTTTDSTDSLSVALQSGAASSTVVGVAPWNPTTSYAKGQLATYDGNLWAAWQPNLNSTPTLSNTNWQLISSTLPGEAALTSVTASAAQALGTLSAVINQGSNFEFLSYQNVAAGAQANQYVLSTLYRGAYGTKIASFPIGSLFVRFKDASVEYDLPAGFSGSTIYFRFTASNSLGGSSQAVDSAQTITFALSPSGDAVAVWGPVAGSASHSYLSVYSVVGGAVEQVVQTVTGGKNAQVNQIHASFVLDMANVSAMNFRLRKGSLTGAVLIEKAAITGTLNSSASVTLQATDLSPTPGQVYVLTVEPVTASGQVLANIDMVALAFQSG